MITLTPLPKPVQVTISLPGSKSITNRALIMAALSKDPVRIINPLWSDDVEAMTDCLKKLGIAIKRTKDTIIVKGSVEDVSRDTHKLNARLSGTTMRFMMAFCCVIPGIKTLTGKGHLVKRPIQDLGEALELLGANIYYHNQYGFPPVTISSSRLDSGVLEMKGNISSQYVTALLMIAPVIGQLRIDLTTPQISHSYIDLTLKLMKDWGVSVENKAYISYTVAENQSYTIDQYEVEGDYSAAGYFAAIAVLTGSKITLLNLSKDSKQGDKQFLKILEDMGNAIDFGDHGVTVTGRGVCPVDVTMEQCPDQAQTLAVLAAFAKGTTTLRGVRSLRVKETERVKAVQNELAKMGIKTESPDEDTLIIYGGSPQPAIIQTYDDHRMAMSFAVAGAKLTGMRINHPEVVHKTFPQYWEKLQSIGVGIT